MSQKNIHCPKSQIVLEFFVGEQVEMETTPFFSPIAIFVAKGYISWVSTGMFLGGLSQSIAYTKFLSGGISDRHIDFKKLNTKSIHWHTI